MPSVSSFTLSPLVERVRGILPDREIYLVGGAVRDALLGHVSHDLDFSVPENAIGLARKVADGLQADFYILDEAFDAARVIVRSGPDAMLRDVLDFASFRTTSAAGGGASSGHRTTGLDEDLRGRDFTINAMAYDPRATSIIDPLKGATDLRAKTIRACGPSAMLDDSVRILRGVRLAVALDFKIEEGTRQAMKEAASSLPKISAERLRDELFKIWSGRRPDMAMRALEKLGVFPYLMPELSAMKGVAQPSPHVADVWEHTLSVMQHLEGILDILAPSYEADKNDDLLTGMLSFRLGRYRERFAEHFGKVLNPERSIRALLFFAALYHDVSKPTTKSVDETGRIRFLGHEGAGAELVAERGRAFNLSNDEIERLQKIVENHMRFHFHTSRLEGEAQEPSRKSIYRFYRDTGEAGVDVVVLGLADLRGVRGHTLTQETWEAALHTARTLLENYWEKPEQSVAPPRLMNGNDLMTELGLEPGPVVGELLSAIREAQAVGQVSTREEAVSFARERMKELDSR